MTDKLSITLAQVNQCVGDIRGNADDMLAVRARAGKVDLVAFPEMQLIGYPPEDLVQKPALIERAQAELDRSCRIGHARGARIVPGGLGSSGPLVGAGAVAWRKLGVEVGVR